MSDRDELQQIPGVGDTDEEPTIDHDPTNGRWLEKEFADALKQWGYRTARNEYVFGLETDVVARRSTLQIDILLRLKTQESRALGVSGLQP